MRRFLLVALMVAAPGAAVGQRRTAADSTQDSTIVLRPIELSVTRQTVSLFKIPFAVATVDGADLKRGRATLGLDEALVQVPGLFVANRYNPSHDQRIAIRGFGSRSAFGARGVKILLDGIPQTLPDGQGQLTNVEIASLGSVEVLRGSSSSLYGNASGGVISLRSASPSPVSKEASVRTVGGAYGMVKLQGRVSAPVGNGTLAINGARTTSGGYRDHAEAEINNLGVRLEQELTAGTTLLVSGHLAANPTSDNPGSLTQAEVDQNPAQANQRNVDADAGESVVQGQLGINLTRRFAAGGSVGVTAFGLTRDLDNRLSFAFIQLDRWAYGVRAIAEIPFAMGSTQPRWSLGVDLQRQRDDRVQRTPDRTTITRDQLERVTEIGPFTQLGVDLGDRVSGTLGMRYDRVSFSAEDRLLTDGDDSGERVMSAASASLGFSWRPSDLVQPYANVSSSFETPTTTELGNRPSGPGGFNPDLEPQRAVSVEAGLRGGGARFSYSASAFHVEVRDALIPFEVPSEPSRQFFQNAGETRHRGLELGVTVRPVDQVTVVSSYTLADYEFEDFETEDGNFDGNDIPGVPGHRFYGSIRVALSSGIWFATDYNVSSSYYVDDANTAENDGWFTTDLRAGWEGMLSGWRLAPFIGVLNVFDERYGASITVNAGFGRYFEPAPPRNVYVGLEIAPRL
jgi:iron complex outermembrane receptor protein